MSQIYRETVEFYSLDNTYIRVACSDSVSMELRQQFSFMAPNAKYDRKYQKKLWDGKIYLYDHRNRKIYTGLKELVVKYCKDNNYTIIDNSEKLFEKIDDDTFNQFIDSLNLPTEINGIPFEIRDYQYNALKIAACIKRALILSPTSSGKSLMMYLMYRWFNVKTLIIVPTTTLVSQLAGDFADYGYEHPVSQIYAGQDKVDLHQITVSTWHSIYKMPAKWLQQFDFILGDEAHGFNAKSLQSIMHNSTAKIRIGTTGTLENIKVNKLTLQGLFGPIYRVTTISEMIDRGYATPASVISYDIKFPDKIIKEVKPKVVDKVKVTTDYPTEIAKIVAYEPRNEFICNLALSCKGNTLVLFRYIDHGQNLFKQISAQRPNTHLVYGKIDTKVRNEIRSIAEKNDDVIVVASFKTFATGINIRNLHHIIIASPLGSEVSLLQSVGRVLRLNKGKEMSYVHDIGDNLCSGTYQNFAYKHFMKRMEIFLEEGFPQKIVKVVLNE